MQEEELFTLHLAAAFLLLDGRQHETAFELMNKEGAFPRLAQLIKERVDDEMGFHRLLLELLYEMCRIQRLSQEDLSAFTCEGHTTPADLTTESVDGKLVLYLFQVIESISNDVDDPYHYPIIRVLVSTIYNAH